MWLLLPIAFIGIFFAWPRSLPDMRMRFVYALLTSSLLVFFSTETFSLFNRISTVSITIFWLLVCIISWGLALRNKWHITRISMRSFSTEEKY
ncbi:MAG: hypothetical protein R2794_13090 [Chitinophagales bacterium]